MNSDVIDKLDEIISLIDNDKDIKKIKILKEKILDNKELISDISFVKNDNMFYGKEYMSLKEKILSDNDFKEFKKIENDLYFLVQEMNLKLKSLLKEVNDENN